MKVLCPATVRCDASYDFICNSLHISTSGVCLTSLSSLADLQLHPKTRIQNSHPKLISKTHPKNADSWLSRFHLHVQTCIVPSLDSTCIIVPFGRRFRHRLGSSNIIVASTVPSERNMRKNRGKNEVVPSHPPSFTSMHSFQQLTHLSLLFGGVCCTYHKLTNLSKYPQLFRSKVLPRPFRASASC